MFNIGMWLGLFFIIGLVYFLKKSSDEKKKGTKFEHKKIVIITVICLWLTSCGSFRLSYYLWDKEEKKEKDRIRKEYVEKESKITLEEKAKAEQENEERKRKFAEQKEEIEMAKKERAPKLIEFQKKLEENKAIYYDSYDKVIRSMETGDDAAVRKSLSDSLSRFKKADQELIQLSKKYTDAETDPQTKAIMSEMWISYQDTMGTKYSVMEVIERYVNTLDPKELDLMRDLGQMARNSEMEHATKDLPKFKREIGE